MSVPQIPEKYDSKPIITPQQQNAYKADLTEGDQDDIPSGVILCYNEGLMEYLVETFEGAYRGSYYGDLYVFSDTSPAVGVMGNFGIGAPTAVMVMEELIADGVETFLSIGWTGCLDRSISLGDFIICEKAIRDEGTSHHYTEPGTFALPSESLTSTIATVLDRRDESFHRGPSWTIDAVYREAKKEFQEYTDSGVLTVEMEAAAVFTVAQYHDVEAAALFVTSDYLGPSEWDPKFHQSIEHMIELGETAKTVLTTHLN